MASLLFLATMFRRHRFRYENESRTITQKKKSWTHGRLLPARRTNLQNTMIGRQRLTSTERRIPSTARTDKAFYSFRSLVPSEPLSSFAARTNTVGSSAPSSLELIRQFHDGRVPNRDALEQSILESYARSAPQSAACQSTQKRCMYPGCSKISVSRGLCRGHGGGRRCHVPGCTKSAQSRSNFCWAHGGGQRCDVDQCMRSRKSKHFCVSHMHLEPSHDGGSGSASPTNSTTMDHRTAACCAPSGASGKKSNRSRATSPPVRALPSLGQALSSASRSAPNLPARSAKPFVSV
jgi:hypothetical protein